MERSAPGVIEALAAQHAELAGILDAMAAEGWRQPTRCPGWNVADVVLHLAQTDELAVASLEDRFGSLLSSWAVVGGSRAPASVDDGAALMVERERGLGAVELRARWIAAGSRVVELLRGADPHRRVTWVAGELSVRTLAATRLAEAWIHTGDVASALGLSSVADGRLVHIARLAWRTLPYAFAREGRKLRGSVAFSLTGPGGEAWSFTGDGTPATVVRGDGVELCLVAARRVPASATGLRAEGPDGDAVLSLVRTYA